MLISGFFPHHFLCLWLSSYMLRRIPAYSRVPHILQMNSSYLLIDTSYFLITSPLTAHYRFIDSSKITDTKFYRIIR